MKTEYVTSGKSRIVYDAELFGQIDEPFFDPEWWREGGQVAAAAVGRGNTWLLRHGDQELALRHYRRGGLPARFSRDLYLWTGLEASRPWAEYHLLAELYGDGLPVPRPVAARVERIGPAYRGDLITQRVPGRPLAEWLFERRLSTATMQAVGRCIRLFHEAGVYHADLNARNIMLADNGEVFLIDFDRGERRSRRGGWRQDNLDRLRRSLDKFRAERDFHFDDEDWRHLMDGYREGPKP